MVSGAQSDLDNGAGEGGEESLAQGAEGHGSQETGEGGVSEKWEDLNPAEFPQIPAEVVTSLNKKAVTQYQNKVRQIVESNKPYKQKAQELEGLKSKYEAKFTQWMEDPEQFLQFHKKTRPDYWQNRQSVNTTAEDKAAREALRKAGFLAKEDIAPLIKKLDAQEKAQLAKDTAAASIAIDEHAKWCAEKKYPWNDQICEACIALISNGHVKSGSLKDAYQILYKHSIDETTQSGLKRKKEGNTLTPAGGAGKSTNLTLRQIVEQSAGDD